MYTFIYYQTVFHIRKNNNFIHLSCLLFFQRSPRSLCQLRFRVLEYTAWFYYSGSNIVFIIMVWKYLSDIWLISPHKPAEDISITTFIFLQYDSAELGEELCPMSSSLPLRVHKVCIRVSFSDTSLRWLPPFVTNSCHYQQRKNFPFYTLLGSGCVLISYSMLSLIIAWLD